MKFIISALIAFSLCMITTAQAAQTNIPADLNYAGKPIDPLCFAELDAEKTTIDLKNCGLAKEGYVKKGDTPELVKKGFFGFNWTEKDSTSEVVGYSYYKVFDAGDKQYWVYTINSGGGSGEFTRIFLVKRDNAGTLSYKAVSGGDRCNGGLLDVDVKDHRMNYSVNLTPFDLIDLGDKGKTKLKPYDDLAACAACCVGKVALEVDRDNKSTFKYVELEKVTNKDELPDQGTYNTCFNNLYTEYSAKGELRLDEAKLQEFVKQFNDKCVNKPQT